MYKSVMQNLNASLPNLEAFVVAAETLNFSVAARRLGLTPQAVSRAVARLEGVLGAPLFVRTTRSLRLTTAGSQYHEACVASLRQLADAEELVRATADRVSGVLRLSAPTSYGSALLPALLATFADRHPRVRIELSLSNRTVDFARDDCDLAIRMGNLSDHPTLKRIVLGHFPVGVFASPGYLKRHGTPACVDDLEQHHTPLVFTMPRTNRPQPWTLHEQGAPRVFVPRHRISLADDVNGLVPLAVAGLGLIQTYDMLAAPAVARGELVEVLTETRGEARAFSVVFSPERTLSTAGRAFVQHVQQSLTTEPSPRRALGLAAAEPGVKPRRRRHPARHAP